MDYRRFLAKTERVVLPYFGGTSVDARDRRLRLPRDARIEEGWWTFDVAGRVATPVARAEAPELSALPVVRGHFAGGWSFSGGRDAARVRLVPEEPAELAPVVARRWPSGDLLFESVDFEGDDEGEARLRLEREEPLGDVKGVPPSLRAAYGFALLRRVARAMRVEASPMEVRTHAVEVAENGRAAAEAVLRALEEERRRHRIREAVRAARAGELPPSFDDAEDRAEHALSEAGARMRTFRLMRERAQIEVAFDFMGERFVAVADALTLHVYDAGVCLAGADEELTLDSLPSVIREAIEAGLLVITRR